MSDPSTIGSGLVRWGKPDTLGLSDGTACATNTDNSGAGHDFTQATGAKQPLYKANIANGLGMLLYDGSDDWMACDPLGAVIGSGPNAPFTFGIVFKFATVTQAGNNHQGIFILASISGGSSPPTHDLFFRTESNNFDSDHRDDQGFEVSGMAGWTPDTNVHTLIYVFDGTNGTFYIDGVADGTIGQTVTGTYTLVNGFTEGAHRRVDGVTAPFSGYFGEDVIYTTGLSSANVALLNNYFIGRYATPGLIPYDPLQSSNMVDWVRDDTSITFSDGATVSTWYSRRIPDNATYSSNAAGIGSPVYKANIQNGRGMMLLDGVAQYFTPSGGTRGQYQFNGTNQPFSVAVVKKSLDQSATHDPWSIGCNNISTKTLVALKEVGTQSYTFTRVDNAGNVKSISGGVPDGNAHVVICKFDGTSGFMYLDGLLIASGDMSTGMGQCDLNFVSIGCNRIGSTVKEFFNGYVGEFVTWQSSLSYVDIVALNGYLMNRWGITQQASAGGMVAGVFSHY
jgi:hypothetical protein